jgi:opacity protein-like surface antigen
MKRFLLTTSACLLALPAMAAGMAPFYRAPPPDAIVSWTGPYVGATLGGDWTGNLGSVTYAPSPIVQTTDAGVPFFGATTATHVAFTGNIARAGMNFGF